jgi:hypothetical protein
LKREREREREREGERERERERERKRERERERESLRCKTADRQTDRHYTDRQTVEIPSLHVSNA